MNGRISTLKEQCMYRVQEGTNAFNNYEVTRFDTEKFAKLIIEECAKIAESKEQGYTEFDPNTSVGWYIRQYFGIE